MGFKNDGKSPSPDVVTSSIKKLLLKFKKDGLNPREINSGYCHDFAYGLVRLVPGSEVWESDPVEDDPKSPVHAFVKVGSLYYDSETINGVKNWKDLPVFKRYMKT